MEVESAFFSGAGPKGSNEDAALLPFRSGENWWAAIADGVGGHEGGEVASQAVVERTKLLIDRDPNTDIRSLFRAARERLEELVAGSEPLSRMGTTFSLVKLSNCIAEIGHVGDTRIYHLRGQGIVDRTEDQTEVRHLIDQGVISKTQAKRYPRRNVLLSVLSAGKEYRLYENHMEIKNEDRLILLTDGVYNKILRREIRDLSLESSSSDELCIRLEEMVKGRIPEDDYTAVCMTVKL